MIKPKETNNPQGEKQFTPEEAQELLSLFPCCKDEVDIEQFRMGLNVELEHGTRYEKLNITNDDGKRTAQIVLAHLMEIPDYYTRLEKMEREGKAAKNSEEEKPNFESEIMGPVSHPSEYDAGDFLLKSTP